MGRKVRGPALTPLAHRMRANGWRVIDVAAAAGCSEMLVRKATYAQVASMRLEALLRIGQAVGMSILEMYPELGFRPERALLERRETAARLGPRVQLTGGMRRSPRK